MNSNYKLVPNEELLTWSTNPPVMPDSSGNYPIPVPGKTKPF